MKQNSGYIGLDLGSTAIKGVLVDSGGNICRSAGTRVAFMDRDNPDIREIDAQGYCTQVYTVIKELVSGSDDVRALSWVAASGNLLIADKDWRPLTPIYSWLDKSADDGKYSHTAFGMSMEDIYRIVGWPFNFQFPLGRLLWISREQPGLLEYPNRVVMNTDYLGAMLTGSWAVDASTGTTMYLYCQENGEKHKPFLDVLGLRESQVPDLGQTGSVLGSVLPGMQDQTGLSAGTSVVLGSFDHPGAARAVGLTSAGQLMLSCGTSWVGCTVLGSRDDGLKRAMLVDPYESGCGGGWFGMFSVSGAGKRFDEWVSAFDEITGELSGTGEGRHSQVGSNPFKVFDDLAVKADPVGILPLLDPVGEDCTTELLSLLEYKQRWNAGEIARGVLEGVVFRLKHKIVTNGIDPSLLEEIFLVGGPTRSKVWPQVIADIFNRPIVIRYGENAGAVGAAVIAARGKGVALVPESGERVFMPNSRVVRAVSRRYRAFTEKYI